MNKTSNDKDRLNSILTRFVDCEGKVDYSSIEEEETVENYVKWLETFDHKNLKTTNEKLAF